MRELLRKMEQPIGDPQRDAQADLELHAVILRELILGGASWS